MSRVVIVTGGSGGIGAATVELFLEAGDQVFMLDINAPKRQHENLHYFNCDLGAIGQIQQVMQDVLKEAHRIDAAVLNAGIFLSANIEETTEADFDRVINVNLKGPFFLMQAILPVMKQQQSGSIVLVGSNLTLVGQERTSAYASSKGGIGQLTKSTAIDYGEYGIRINCVCPGVIHTDLYDRAIVKLSQNTGESVADIEEKLKAMHAIGRIGEAKEVAQMIYFLSTDKASFITGSLFPVDGGYTAQ